MVKKVMLALALLCVCMMLVPTFDSYAQGINEPFYLPYAEPSTSDTQGYITVLFTYGDGHYWTNTFFWSTHAVISGGVPTSSVMSITMTPDSINFNVIANNTAKSCMYSLFHINEANRYGWVTLNTSSDFTYDMGSKKIVGWRASGNIGRVYTTFGSSKFDLYFGSDGKALLLGDILSVLSRTENIETSILEKVKSIFNSVDGIESQLSSVINYLKSIDDELVGIKDELEDIYAKADEILEEEKKQTSLLEKIFNWLNESKEQEKQEVQTQGSNSVTQGSDSIENSGQGFGDSLGGLVSSMSYSGTECKWTFPEVRMPAIKGVMKETVLIEEQPIDFGVWIDSIPANIILLIRSVLTGALIIYCFKELYGTISYVLTLKGSGVNE